MKAPNVKLSIAPIWKQSKISDDNFILHPERLKIKDLDVDCQVYNNAQVLSIEENGRMIAYDVFNKEKEGIYDQTMYVEENYRKRGLGSMLRLFSLMLMKENKMPFIKLESYPNALPFHRKFAFSTNFESPEVAAKVLEDIADNKNKHLEVFSKTAGALLNAEKLNLAETSSFVDAFIDLGYRILAGNDIIKHNVPMKLASEDVQLYRIDYNRSFEKCNVDYKI